MNLIFDLDGTIVDSYNGIEAAFSATVAQLNLFVSPAFVLKNQIGKPLLDIFFNASGNPLLSQKAVPIFREIYNEKHVSDFNLYPQASTVLHKLHEQGHSIFVVTNKAHLLANQMLIQAGLRHLIKNLYGPDLHSSIKKSELMHSLLKQNPDLHAKNSIMIGDTRNDLEAAALFNIPVYILLHGYGKKTDFNPNEITGFCNNFTELDKSISSHHANL